MAAGGREVVEQEPRDFDVDGLDIDAALFAEPEAQARRSPTDDLGKSPEGQAPTFLRSPIRPSAEDVEKHDATHVPYRNWCPICVDARGNEDPHRLPKFSLDHQEL